MSRMVGKDTITGMGFIGLEHGRLYKMRRGPNVIIATITGRRIVLEKCAGGKLRGLILYGKSTQVTTTGAQLIDINSFQKNNSVSVKIVNNYSIELTSTIEKDASDSNKVYLNVLIDADILVGKTITMSYDEWNSNVPNEISIFGVMYNLNGKTIYEHINSKSKIKTVTIPLDATDCRVRLFLTEGVATTVKAGTYTAIIKGLMICEGTVAKSWEQYTGMQPSPSLNYPQEIINSGNNGSLDVTLHGKNLIDYKTIEYTQTGWLGKHSVSNNVLTISAVKGWSLVAFKSPVLLGEKVSLSFKYRQVGGTSGDCNDAFCIVSNHEVTYPTNMIYRTNHPSSEWTDVSASFFSNEYIAFFMRVDKESGDEGTSRIIEIIDVQLEVDNQSTEYEPYCIPQTLSIELPNGLPGIPVSSGGNYTDENGLQWICDEVNLERGVYVQRINELAFDQLLFSYEKTPVNRNDTFIASIDEQLSGTETGHAMCQYAYFDGVSYELAMQEDCRCYVWRNNVTIQFRDSVGVNTLEAFAEWLISHPKASISYVLATPIETPLSETDIAAYRALAIYDQATIVETNSGGLKVSYNKIVEKD